MGLVKHTNYCQKYFNNKNKLIFRRIWGMTVTTSRNHLVIFQNYSPWTIIISFRFIALPISLSTLTFTGRMKTVPISFRKKFRQSFTRCSHSVAYACRLKHCEKIIHVRSNLCFTWHYQYQQ